MSTANNHLSITNLTVSYPGKTILDQVNLVVHPAEICCIIGEEGAGKSTLVSAITQQIKSRGQMFFGSLDLTRLSTADLVANSIDFIVQGGNILHGFTVEEHIRLASSARKPQIPVNEIWQQITARFPHMLTLRKQVAGLLSGGERMILSMACVLATDASLLILDEPTAGLSPETCEAIAGFLLHLQKEKQRCILITEHNYEFAFRLANTVVTLKNGKLSPKYQPAVFRQPHFIETGLYALQP